MTFDPNFQQDIQELQQRKPFFLSDKGSYLRKEVDSHPALFEGLNLNLRGVALLETNIAPENGWLEDYFHIEEAYFQGLCWFQGCYWVTVSFFFSPCRKFST